MFTRLNYGNRIHVEYAGHLFIIELNSLSLLGNDSYWKFCKHWEATCIKNLILQTLLCDRYNYYKEIIQKSAYIILEITIIFKNMIIPFPRKGNKEIWQMW